MNRDEKKEKEILALTGSGKEESSKFLHLPLNRGSELIYR